MADTYKAGQGEASTDNSGDEAKPESPEGEWSSVDVAYQMAVVAARVLIGQRVQALADRLDAFEGLYLESSVEEWVDEIKATQAKVETLEAQMKTSLDIGIRTLNRLDVIENQYLSVEEWSDEVKANQANVESLEAEIKALSKRLYPIEDLHLECALNDWVDEIKATQAKVETLEAEIAFQRKANSSWQTPIPYSHGQGLDIQGRIV